MCKLDDEKERRKEARKEREGAERGGQLHWYEYDAEVEPLLLLSNPISTEGDAKGEREGTVSMATAEQR